nr:MAG TPA: hypothetical protein [Caudoviricetes sp.]
MKRAISGRFRGFRAAPSVGVYLWVSLQHSERRASIDLDTLAGRRVL